MELFHNEKAREKNNINGFEKCVCIEGNANELFYYMVLMNMGPFQMLRKNLSTLNKYVVLSHVIFCTTPLKIQILCTISRVRFIIPLCLISIYEVIAEHWETHTIAHFNTIKTRNEYLKFLF